MHYIVRGKYLEYIGEITLPIYFWHMILVNRFLDTSLAKASCIAALIKSILTISIMTMAIYCLMEASRKVHCENVIRIVFGIRYQIIKGESK